ncbi:excinuclease ABC subunit UvrC [Pedosphaera parvula]|uniref:Excinuclease ABC C subunit domain protein n=1 Tax=Pedosphaera parvula (strain Ellin514) TaxID=320771 RepID=B9XGZ6_PEDPL|nr:excinuclease ABC subunit UvrC [Pedosphaera parvula]EEF60917.1 excinuclease ABC C subunit domain protein [Pedosphaera parvula Ellin514]
MAVSALIRSKLNELPHKPGIYLMKDRFGTVIYVGKARDLRKRVSQYFHPSRKMGWDLKFKALTEAIYDLDVHVVRSEPEALLLEGKLIKEFHPRYNISFKDDKRFLMLKVNLNDPIPRFTLTRFKQDDGARYFGPFAHSSALKNTLTMIRRQFHLRGCRPLTPNERDYKHCLYGNLKHCTAPCIGNVTREQYLAQVQAACDFLSGQGEEMQEQLAEEMKKAAAAQDYERAAMLRDAISDLRQTTKKTVKFERLPYNLPLAIEPQRDLAELGQVLDLAGPPMRIEGFDISNISGTFAVSSLVSFKNGRPDRSNYRKFKMKSVVGQNDFACMAETIRRRYSRLLREGKEARKAMEAASANAVPQPSENASEVQPALPGSPLPSNLPDLILIDGGKGQLNAACEELEKLGLSQIPIIGLAKEFEEIYRPGQSEPLRLSHASGALKLLQRVRDESHRLANTYNAELRLKKISESILDEFPNIGQRRKADLLKKFGSVQRLRIATVEQIAEVPGFGGKMAADLKAFLEARSSTPVLTTKEGEDGQEKPAETAQQKQPPEIDLQG